MCLPGLWAALQQACLLSAGLKGSRGEKRGAGGEEEGLSGLVVIKATEVIVLEQNHAAFEPLQCGC